MALHVPDLKYDASSSGSNNGKNFPPVILERLYWAKWNKSLTWQRATSYVGSFPEFLRLAIDEQKSVPLPFIQDFENVSREEKNGIVVLLDSTLSRGQYVMPLQAKS